MQVTSTLSKMGGKKLVFTTFEEINVTSLNIFKALKSNFEMCKVNL